MRASDIFDLVGGTPCVRISERRGGHATWVKLEGCNPTGSVKDRACARMLDAVREAGGLSDGVRLLDASSGNMASAIAVFGRVLAMPVTVVSSSKLTPEKHDLLRYFGAEVELVGNFTIDGNRHCRTLVEREPDRFHFLDQLHNPLNPQAHYETTGPELVHDFPQLAAVVGSLGSGGTMAGVARFLREHSPRTVVVTVEAESGTRIPGTGSFRDGDYVTPFMQQSYDEGLFPCQVAVSESEAFRQTQWLRDRGVFGGVQTGGLLAALHKSGIANDVDGDIVLLSGDAGWKNLQKLIALERDATAES